jgi:tyrosyl-tRNA synthetase
MDRVRKNVGAIRGQLERFLDFGGVNAAVLVNNADWLLSFNLLDFLRDVGRRFRVGEMLARESVRRRMEADDGISFTEFAYQILQAYDFLHLYRTLGVRLQIGGGDQWGNIIAGIDLIRREESAHAFGMVIPLVTDSQGRKFGKSVGGAAYLDAALTTPYQMYQFLLNAEDACVVQYLKYYTFLALEEIAQLDRETREHPERRLAQRKLASEVVRLVHGREGLSQAEKATAIFFGAAVENVSETDILSIFAEVPRVEVPRERLAAGMNIIELLAATPLWKGRNDVRRSIGQKGAYLNNRPVEQADLRVDSASLAAPGVLIVRKGKKNYALVRVV